MNWLSTILELLKDLFAAIPIISRYFPPKSVEQKVEDGAAAIDSKISAEQDTGRPSP